MHQLIARLSVKINKISNLATDEVTEEAIKDTSASTNSVNQIHPNVNSKRLLSSCKSLFINLSTSGFWLFCQHKEGERYTGERESKSHKSKTNWQRNG